MYDIGYKNNYDILKCWSDKTIQTSFFYFAEMDNLHYLIINLEFIKRFD